jgi:hypothetical protein
MKKVEQKDQKIRKERTVSGIGTGPQLLPVRAGVSPCRPLHLPDLSDLFVGLSSRRGAASRASSLADRCRVRAPYSPGRNARSPSPASTRSALPTRRCDPTRRRRAIVQRPRTDTSATLCKTISSWAKEFRHAPFLQDLRVPQAEMYRSCHSERDCQCRGASADDEVYVPHSDSTRGRDQHPNLRPRIWAAVETLRGSVGPSHVWPNQRTYRFQTWQTRQRLVEPCPSKTSELA